MLTLIHDGVAIPAMVLEHYAFLGNMSFVDNGSFSGQMLPLPLHQNFSLNNLLTKE